MTPEFLLTTLVVVASPGTGVLYTLAAGLSRGARASVVAAFGCTLGILPHMAAAVTGLAALLHASAVAFEVVKVLGVAYLLYMAWATLREHGPLKIDDPSAGAPPAPPRAADVIVSAVLLNLLNPKLSIFFFAFLPQFVSPAAPGALGEMLTLSAVFMAVTFVVFAGYGVFAAAVRRHLLARPRVVQWMRRAFAAAFVALGAKLALAER
jgi:threonine/homoserine/homoserine lactone efflux protein